MEKTEASLQQHVSNLTQSLVVFFFTVVDYPEGLLLFLVNTSFSTPKFYKQPEINRSFVKSGRLNHSQLHPVTSDEFIMTYDPGLRNIN